jgi:HEAT repeat protein/type 1 glutamine amidotransferase
MCNKKRKDYFYWKGKVMNRLVKLSIVMLVFVLCFGLAPKVSTASKDAPSIKALMVTGQNSQWHPWELSSPILKQMLEQTGLFKVDMAISPPGDEGIKDYRPDFAKYDVLVINYDNAGREGWSKETERRFVEYVRGGGGVVVYHGSNNSFPKWKQYNEITGVGGWGGRDEKSGPMVRWRDGKTVLDYSPGDGGSHGPAHAFQIVTRAKDHPVMRGLPKKWMHAKDELYGELRGPAKKLTVLATAYSDPAKDGTGEHEPMLFTIDYGKGRVFHTTLGHARELPLTALECVGFIVTFQRGTEWAATGKVTQKVSEDFPTADEVRRWRNYRPPRSVKELLGEISTYEYGQSRENLTELSDIIRGSYEKPQELRQIEKELVKFLASDATLAGKQFVCKQLSIIGTEQAVPTLAKMLKDENTSDMARYALERIPGGTVDKALVKGLGKTKGKVKVGIINSLGERGAKHATDSLSKLLKDKDEEIALAAAAALGKIGDEPAAGALGKALKQASGDLRIVVADAYLACADKLAAGGDKDAAMAIYKKLYKSDEPVRIRSGALAGMVAAAPDDASKVVINAISGGEREIQSVAIGLVREVPGTKIIKASAAKLPKLAAAQQVQLLSALADRGDRAALGAVVEATENSEESVRIAALNALGRLGDASAVDLLARVAASKKGAERQAARDSLYRLRDPATDEKILDGIDKAGAKVKVELVRSVGQRHIVGGVDKLLKTARDTDGNVRQESVKALREVAGPEHVPALVELLKDTEDDTELKAIEKTIVSASGKSAVADAGAVMAAIDSVENIRIRCSLLRVLGGIGDEDSLEILREALEDEETEVRTAAVRALSDWPDGELAEELLEVAEESEDEKLQTLALRGSIRLIGLESERPAEETVELYRQAMELAPSVSEKKLVLSGVADVEVFGALYLAYEHLDDEELREEAAAAMVEIAMETAETHPQQTRILLREVIRLSENESVREWAQEIMEELE